MKTKTQKIYIAEDGTEFFSQTDCEKHEEKLKHEEKTTSYWQIIHKPDLTEGRGYYGLIYAKVRVGEYQDPEMLLQDYCFRTFGRLVAFAQGCSPMSNWWIEKSDFKKYKQGDKIKVGDYSYDSTNIDLVMGRGESGLILKEK